MAGGTARLAAWAAPAAVLLVVSYAIASGGGVGGVGTGPADRLAWTPSWVHEGLERACGCDPVETVLGGLSTLADGAVGAAEAFVRAVLGYGARIGEAFHAVGPTGLAASAPAIAGIAAGALLIAFWRIATAKAETGGTDTVEVDTPTGSSPAGVPGSFRHVSPSADALIHQVEELAVEADRSLVEVIAFMIVAEFGVLSSVTISAPDPQVGLGFFVLFLAGSAIFVRHPYREYATALYHLAVGVVTAVMVSILLGHFWAQIPLEVLFSQGYFATASMVAAVTGIAFSLLLGGR